MTTRSLDDAKVTAFAQRMTGTINEAFLALMISIGHQTKLFDTMARLPPATSEEIARAAELQERYVREWLGAVVTGRIVDYDPATRTYTLPPEHAVSLTRMAGSKNVATVMPFVGHPSPFESLIPRSVLLCLRPPLSRDLLRELGLGFGHERHEGRCHIRLQAVEQSGVRLHERGA